MKKINPASIFGLYIILSMIVTILLMRYHYNRYGGGADLDVLVSAMPIVLLGSLLVNLISMIFFKEWVKNHKVIAIILILLGSSPIIVEILGRIK